MGGCARWCGGGGGKDGDDEDELWMRRSDVACFKPCTETKVLTRWLLSQIVPVDLRTFPAPPEPPDLASPDGGASGILKVMSTSGSFERVRSSGRGTGVLYSLSKVQLRAISSLVWWSLYCAHSSVPRHLLGGCPAMRSERRLSLRRTRRTS